MDEIMVFEQCPIYQSEHFYIRQMKMEDARGLFQCYSNPQAAKYFNGDCCNDDFYYTDFDRFVKCMEFWESRYKAKDFVRFTIVDTGTDKIIGMAEVCPSYKYSADDNCMGILRLDLLPEYETEAVLNELLDILLKYIYKDFAVRSVIIKAQCYADIRRNVLKRFQFVPAQEECNISFLDYFVRYGKRDDDGRREQDVCVY